MKGKWLFGSFIVGSFLFQYFAVRPALLHTEVFGWDGNGGKMLKIITSLTDEEMARLKFVRRMSWHWRGSRRVFHGENTIQD
mmetsp:Transcript_42190/g.40421  ORF Transcript_42190/g.40421 Transcript_42190/m.40421 type:complete len:82 (+) Transcript_42190:45-290(+)